MCLPRGTRRGVQRPERRGGVVFVEGVQWVLGIELVKGIVGVARVVLVHRIRGVAGIILIERIQRILRIVGVDRIQRIIGTVLIEGVEDIRVALVFLGEACFGECRCDGEERCQEKDEESTHGESPGSGTASALSLLSAWMTAQGRLTPFYSLARRAILNRELASMPYVA